MEKTEVNDTSSNGVTTAGFNCETSTTTLVLPVQQGELATDVVTNVLAAGEFLEQELAVENSAKAVEIQVGHLQLSNTV